MGLSLFSGKPNQKGNDFSDPLHISEGLRGMVLTRTFNKPSLQRKEEDVNNQDNTNQIKP